MSEERVVIVGAGAGGLSSAVRLAAQGLPVVVLEAGSAPGGKIRSLPAAGRPVDAGPTVFTMRWVFEELAASAGRRLEDLVRLTPLEVLARHHWAEGETLDLFSDLSRSADAVGEFAGGRAAEEFLAFHAEARAIFTTLRASFLERDQTGPLGLARRLGPARFPELFALRPFATLAGRLAARFQDPRLRQLYGRYATYCGSSPYAAPATLMLIAHVEQAGVFAVEGGMTRLAEAMARLAEEAGAVLRYGAGVRRILVRRRRVVGVELASGETLAASQVIFNGDPQALVLGELGPELRRAARPRPLQARSLSALVLTLEAETSGVALDRHNVFFSKDYAREFSRLAAGELPEDPTVYVCAQDRAAAEPPGGRERLLVLVNAPALGEKGELSHEELSRCTTGIWDRLRRSGLEARPTEGSLTLTSPNGFHRRFPASSGALYGGATHGWAAAFRRPGARTPIPGLYLVGGAVHPGPGVPMAVLSGRLAAERLQRDLASTSRSRAAATPGGTSTRLARTAGMA